MAHELPGPRCAVERRCEVLAFGSLRIHPRERRVIGIAEYVDIPEWRIVGLRAKVDTGARSSALHVENLREVGRSRVRFDVRLHRLKADRRVTVEALVVRRARVRSSTGAAATRIFVAATVRIGHVVQRIELGLVDRAHMIYRMLLGRTALGAHFLVDPSRRYLLTAGEARKRAGSLRPSRQPAAPSRRSPV
jgi:hypothetical protein